jgi:DnaJ-class molecular chaperone
MKDPYLILGVSKTATLADIKAAYRKLAKKYHPDLNPGNKKFEIKFKEISHSFDLIGTEEARAKFDRGETDEQKQQQYEEHVRNQSTKKQRPYYHHTQDNSSRYSSAFGQGFDEEMFANMFGGKGGGAQNENYSLEVDFKDAALGAEQVITLPSGKKLQVKIPAGIQSGQKLKFKGMGKSGDILVEINIKPSAQFKREGMDIFSEVPISFFEAMNGPDIEITTLDGPVMLKIPPGVTTGTKLRIKQKGAGSGEARGNHIVSIKVVMPKDPPEDLKKAIFDLSNRFNYNPRDAI